MSDTLKMLPPICATKLIHVLRHAAVQSSREECTCGREDNCIFKGQVTIG